MNVYLVIPYHNPQCRILATFMYKADADAYRDRQDEDCYVEQRTVFTTQPDAIGYHK
jgi:hypothetical protein